MLYQVQRRYDLGESKSSRMGPVRLPDKQATRSSLESNETIMYGQFAQTRAERAQK